MMNDDENAPVNDEEQVSEDLPRFFWFRLISFILLIVGSVILSGESTKWGEWDLDWPLWAYPCCVAGMWTLAGLILWVRAWPAVFVSCPVAGVGGWFTIHSYLSSVETTTTIISFLIYALGALPGVGLFIGVTYILMRYTKFKLFSEDDQDG
jgi:hypothetical protein